MPHRCAFGCKDTGNVMHSFPNPGKFPERFKAWVNLVGYNLETLTDYDIYKKKRICDIHFTDEHRNRFKRLNALAMPTLLLPGESHGITATAGQSEASLSLSPLTTSTSLPTSTPDESYDIAATTQQFEVVSVSHTSTNTSLLAPSTSDRSHCTAATNSVIKEHNYSAISAIDHSKRVPQKSYAQAASATLDVSITCDRTGILSMEVSDQVLAAIQRQIILEACSPKQDTPGPTFNAKPLFAGGVLKLWCGNDHTLAWLKKTVSALSLPASMSLVVKSQSEIQKRARCGIVIPDEQGVFGDSTNIGRALSYQNPWVDITRWVLLFADKQAAQWFVVVGVPVDQIPTLMEAGRRLSIGLGAVYVKFQGTNGRFTDIPQGWDLAMETIGEEPIQPETPAGEGSPPLNNPEASAAEPSLAGPAAPAAATVGAVPSSGED